jgi:hypothetical protein
VLPHRVANIFHTSIAATIPGEHRCETGSFTPPPMM